jgi:hypothetical protein
MANTSSAASYLNIMEKIINDENLQNQNHILAKILEIILHFLKDFENYHTDLQRETLIQN